MGHVSHPRDYERSDADLRLIGALALGTATFLWLLLMPCLLSSRVLTMLASCRPNCRSAGAAVAGSPQGRSGSATH